MSRVIIDAREWQNMFDLETGGKMTDTNPLVNMVQAVLADHPYPGDTDACSNRWVSETALDLIETYQPGLVCLTYAHQYFTGRYMPKTASDIESMIDDAFLEVDRFVNDSGYIPVIIGTGNMTDLIGEIDLSRLDGLAVLSAWSSRYAGLHNPSNKDLAYVKSVPEIEKVVTRDEWISLFDGINNITCDIDLMPDFLLVARKGWTYRTLGALLRKPVRIHDCSLSIPVSTSLGTIDHITDVRSMIDSHLKQEKIALIIMEGIGSGCFKLPHTLCDNSKDWFLYEPGDGQYLTLTTGRHQVFAYPTGYRYFDIDAEKTAFPFSGYFTEIPRHTIGADFDGKSIAVGNRSIFMHMAFGADISIECFARNLYNQGSMAVIHDNTKY
jgi:hypothetical protein